MSKRAEEVSEDDNTLAKYFTKLKIVVALYQIIGSMDAVMPQVPFPEALSFVFTFTRFFNLSLLSMLPLECFESVNYFQQLVFTTLFPIGLGIIGKVGSELYGRSSGKLASVRATASYMLLLLSFVVLPSCSLMIFTYFGCVSYDLGDYDYVDGVFVEVEDPLSVLAADATIECYGARYGSWGWYVGLMIAVYPVGECLFVVGVLFICFVGVPLYYFVVLYRLRRYLNPQDADLEGLLEGDDLGPDEGSSKAGLSCDFDGSEGGSSDVDAELSSDVADAEADEAKAMEEVELPEEEPDEEVELEPSVVITEDFSQTLQTRTVSLDDVASAEARPDGRVVTPDIRAVTPDVRVVTLEAENGDPDGLVITEDPRPPPLELDFVERSPEADGFFSLSCLCTVSDNTQDTDIPAARGRTPPTPPQTFGDDDEPRVRFGGAPAAPDADAATQRGDVSAGGARPSRRLSATTALQRNSMILEATEEMRAVGLEARRLEYRELYSKDRIAGVQFLVEEYEPRCWWFSVFDCVRLYHLFFPEVLFLGATHRPHRRATHLLRRRSLADRHGCVADEVLSGTFGVGRSAHRHAEPPHLQRRRAVHQRRRRHHRGGRADAAGVGVLRELASVRRRAHRGRGVLRNEPLRRRFGPRHERWRFRGDLLHFGGHVRRRQGQEVPRGGEGELEVVVDVCVEVRARAEL